MIPLSIGIAALLSLLIGAAGIAAARAIRQRRRHRDFELLLVILDLMRELQLHRALSGMHIDGDHRHGGELAAAEHKLGRSLNMLAGQFGDRHRVFHSEAWGLVVSRWNSILDDWRGLDFYTNLLAHSDAVGGLIVILRKLADDCADDLGAARVNVLTDWPPLVEHLGMSRALGMHLLLRRDAPDLEQIYQSLRERATLARLTLQGLRLPIPDRQLRVSTERLLERIDWLLDGNAERYHAYPYYEEITEVIEGWHRAIVVHLLAGESAEPPARFRWGALRLPSHRDEPAGST